MKEGRKRVRGSPTGVTPRQPEKRSSTLGEQSKKRLSFSYAAPTASRVPGNWSESEDNALVDFIMLTSTGESWPSTISEVYWTAAARHVHQLSKLPIRTCECVDNYELVL